MSGSGHTLLLGSTSGTTFNGDSSGQMRCLQSNDSSCEVPMVSGKASLATVHLHGGYTESLSLGDMTKSGEDIIRKLLGIHYPTIGPAAIHLFGLAVLDTKKNDRFIWKSPRCLIKELQGQIKNDANLKLYVRMRFVPAKDRLPKLNIFGEDVTRYLYHQLREDLLSERIKNIYGSRNQLTSPKCRGLAVLNLLIDSRVQKKPVETILDTRKLKDFLPPSECVAFLKKMKLEKNMKDHVKKFDLSHPENSTDIEELMRGYIRDILKEILDYSVEQYDANTFDMAQSNNIRIPKKILIDIHHNPSGVFIDGLPFSRIEDLYSASITPSYTSNTWNVHVDRNNGRPEVLEFESQELAQSFVSCLDGYYRLTHDFYFSLCRDMEPLSLRSLKQIKSHGPMETTCAIEKLSSKMDDQECYYLCKQDINDFDKFILVYPSRGQIMTEHVQQVQGMFYLLRDKEMFDSDPGKLVPHLLQTEHNNILSNNMIRLSPKYEACGVLKRLFMDEKEAIPEEDQQQKDENVLSRQPVIIPESHLRLKKVVGIGKFTEVCEGLYKDSQPVAVKSLRTRTSPNQLYNCQEPFLYALRQQMKFREVQEPTYFAGIIGVCMTMPIKIVMNYAKEGSLSHFFSNRRTDQPIYIRHLVYTALQVAQGLYQLEERNLHHGNICCQNILVYVYDINEIVVKIGDPGMVQVYNSPSMADSEKVNKKRYPWVAPELFDKEHDCTNMKSDIFAFGTTIWEMFALGENPIDKPPLSSMSFDGQKKFYRSDNNRLPNIEGLRIQTSDPTHITKCKTTMADMIDKCRVISPEERPTAKELVRDLNTLTASYANEYHDYDSIQDDNYPIWSEAETSHEPESDDEVPAIPSDFRTPELKDSFHHTEEDHETRVKQVVPEVPPIQDHRPGPVPPAPRRSLPSVPFPTPQRPLPDPNSENPAMIRSTQLEISNKTLGEGHYGKVMLGYLRFQERRIQIAAKCLKGKDYRSVLESQEFKREAKMMEELRHPNIVRFFGICNDKIVMEYVDNGSMSCFLRKQQEKNQCLSPDKLMDIMLDIAEGMKYMSEKRIIHSDLAGRNILMTIGLRAKISDFGLARNLNDKEYYRRSREKELPASWCSPEGLMHLKFTTPGDVWSYGVVLWEAFTHGKRPSYGKDLKDLTQRLVNGTRLESPEGCPEQVRNLMMWCWKYEPRERPTFQEIQKECTEILQVLRPEETRLKSVLQDDQVTKQQQISVIIAPAFQTVTTPANRGVISPEITSPGSPMDSHSDRLPRSPRDKLDFLISKKDLHVYRDKVLGQGEFGSVFKGLYKQEEVAIKVIAESYFNRRNEELFWDEVDVFGTASHPNIVTFKGFVRDSHMLVMEFVPKGSLSEYLSKCKSGRASLSLRQNLGIMNDIASGMKYLAQKRIIHCDLAARNILLMDNMMAKISDFGLSKAIQQDKDYYRRGNEKKMPCWWCAPEVLLKQRLSHESDVWSYGIVAWEIFTLGEIPNICEVGGKDIQNLITIGLAHMEKGFRLKKEKTKNCPDDVYQLMMDCWAWEAKDRPQFTSLHEKCLALLDKYGRALQQ
ncbi:tyrosine-protein kinase JAK2-like [Argopecten irradians]|uniref:tyrosine-protein kinase JAK2-like n=1 Tax=Argopecten irradians TaxID=31199 RepID=UPI00371CDAF9